jgi:hypothetical protein
MDIYYNTLIICGYFIFYVLIDFIIKLFFRKRNNFEVKNFRYHELKCLRVKSINEQKEYIKLQHDLGNNFVTIIIINMLFILAYSTLIYGSIPSFIIGVISALIFAPPLAFVASQNFNKGTRSMFFFTFLNGLLFIFIFLNFVKFFKTISIWFIILIFLIIGYLFSKIFNMRR